MGDAPAHQPEATERTDHQWFHLPLPTTAAETPTDPQLTANGHWQLMPLSGTTAHVAFACHAVATPTALATGIETCSLYRNGTLAASAPGIGAPGPVAATAATFPFIGTTDIQVCWQAWAAYIDGTLRTTAACNHQTLL